MQFAFHNCGEVCGYFEAQQSGISISGRHANNQHLTHLLITCCRIISTTVSHKSNYFTPITITIIYAPATRSDRLVFFRGLATNLHSFFQLDPTNQIVLGDWNYSYAIFPVQISGRAPYEWLQSVSKSFVDCISSPGDAYANTFHRGTGMTLLVSNIESLFRQFSSEMTAQSFNLQQGEQLLQKKRSGILTQLAFNHLPSSDLLLQLRIVDNQLSSIQQYHNDTLALRTSIRWREKGENSASYLKRTVQHNARQKNISCLRHPVTSALCYTKDDMLQAATSFYSSLYTTDPINSVAIDQLFSLLPPEFCISNTSKSNLVRPFTLEDITEAVRRCPSQSSPGSDGLPYTFLTVLFGVPACQSVFLQVLNDALTIGVYPPSWSDTRSTLVY
ncbi:hypothetical protein G6F56_004484 [Rhizopus delemar]|nr:hypothetical protein G6F56_004484 [Rhizopus delemar]